MMNHLGIPVSLKLFLHWPLLRFLTIAVNLQAGKKGFFLTIWTRPDLSAACCPSWDMRHILLSDGSCLDLL